MRRVRAAVQRRRWRRRRRRLCLREAQDEVGCDRCTTASAGTCDTARTESHGRIEFSADDTHCMRQPADVVYVPDLVP